jgi:hypothetical protein
VKKVWTHGILIDRKSLKRYCVLPEEKPDDIGRQLENSPQKYVQWLALECCFCRQCLESN